MKRARHSTPTGSRSPGRGSSPTAAARSTRPGLDFYDRLVDELRRRRHRADGDALPLGPAAGAPGRGGWQAARRPPSASRSTPPSAPSGSATGSASGCRSTSPTSSPLLGHGIGDARPGPARSASTPSRSPTTSTSPTASPCRRCARTAPAQVGTATNHAPVWAGLGRARTTSRPPTSSTRSGTGSSPTRCCSAATPRAARDALPVAGRRPRDDPAAARLLRLQLLQPDAHLGAPPEGAEVPFAQHDIPGYPHDRLRLADRARGAARGDRPAARALPRHPADLRHRERLLLRHGPRRATAWSTTSRASTTSTATCAPSPTRSPTAPTCAATTAGR